MNENVPPNSEQNLEAPAKLVAALKDGAQWKIFIPPAVDGAILKAARTQRHPESKSNVFLWPRWVLWPALAGACAVIALLARMLGPSQFAREDLNRDGKVDILDSFALARELKSGEPVPKAFDVNGDGVVDERDINQIAAHAVSLGKESRS
jgi:hypothetical protein